MKLKITLLFSILLATISYAQYDWTEGELVLKNGDTLSGQIKLPTIVKGPGAINGKEKVKFRFDKKSKKTKYDDNDVDKVIFSLQEEVVYEYVPVSLRKKSLFKIIINDRVKLYNRKVRIGSSSYSGGSNGVLSPNFDSSEEYYVISENQYIATRLINSGLIGSFRQKAMDYFIACPSLVAKLENRTYTKYDIVKVVEEHIACITN